jgi:uncharacterized protein
VVNAYFLDTSALVKRYVPETGSLWIQSITDGATSNDLAISQITWVELHSALARRQREGSVSADELDIILQKFRNEFDTEYRVIEVDQALIESAGQLVMQNPLRAYDAVQLASGLYVKSLLASMPDTQLIFVSADNRLVNIAQSEGLASDNPNNYP